MKRTGFIAILWSLVVFVTDLNATNDTISLIEYYYCDFESLTENSGWEFKNSTGKNKWNINSYDGNNTCLYISENAQDTAYGKKSASISLAYRKILISSADSLLIEFDVNIGGEGAKDYLKVMLVEEDFDFSLPSPSSSSLGFIGAYYKDNSFLFEDENAYYSESKGEKHVVAKMKNIFSCDSAYLVFVWRNDNTAGFMPGAIVDNIVLGGEVTTVNKSLCKGEYFTFGNKTVNESGVYYDTIQTGNSCDSVVKYNVVVYDTFIQFANMELCEGESYVLTDGSVITNSGFYVDNQKTTSGCDSIINLNITFKPNVLTTIHDTICSNEQYNKNGFVVNQTGLYFDTLTSQNGCDSIVNLLLTVHNAYTMTYVESICTGEIFDEYGFNESESGFYTQTLQTINGCDSIVNLNLKVADEYIKILYDTICEGQVYSDKGFTENTEGIYTLYLESVNGCDSVLVLHLKVNPSNLTPMITNVVKICQGESVEFCNKTLTTSGHYEETLQNVYGCDSVVALDLTVSPVYWIIDSVTIENGKQYKWNGKTYSQNGNYIDTLKSVDGCDSIVTLCLTVHSSLLMADNTQEISVFPNPASEKLHIKFKIAENQRVISLFNEVGEEMKAIQVPANQMEIIFDVKNLPKGVYFLQIDDNGFSQKHKIVIL